MSGNRTLGNSFENHLAERLHENGFWVHLLKQSQAGQPADIICVKNNHAALIDCKVCSDGRFDTHRIETNQTGSMKAWRQAGNIDWWFAIELPDGDIRMIPGDVADQWILRHTSYDILWSELLRFMTLEGWWERFEN